MEYTNKLIDQEILNYFYLENLTQYITVKETTNYKYRYQAGFEVNPNLNIEFPPDITDLVRMHQLVRERKSLTVLEFGVGYSTLIYADAMMKNEKEMAEIDTCDLVWNNKFEVHSVDSSKRWIRHFKRKLKKFPHLKKYINLYYSELKMGTYRGQTCHYYTHVPDIIPDFIYLDGPCPDDVKGSVNGMTFKQQDRTVMAADILLMESVLSPGTFILVDGRSNNARFLKNNFKRKWEYNHETANVWPLAIEDIGVVKFEDWNDHDFTTFELVEFPLNYWNYKKIQLCCLPDSLEKYLKSNVNGEKS